jgi:Bax protein
MTAAILDLAPWLKRRTFVAAALALGLAAGAGVLRYLDATSGAIRWDVEIDTRPLPVAAVEKTFAKLQYDFTVIKNGGSVPRVRLRAMPDDLGQVPEVERRKGLFLASVLPLVLAVNEQILREREDVETIAKKVKSRERLSRRQSADLERLARVYRLIDDEDDGDITELSDSALVNELLLRVSPMPVSLALAQAAEESAWGLSRFATEGNALFGQWVWNDDVGIIPKDRPEGQTHSVRAFKDIFESTLSYAHNINTHRAYGAFRRLRADMINANGHLDGEALAGTLTRYSGRGQAYIESLRSIIRANGLDALDRARFIDQTTTRITAANSTAS